MASTRLLFLAVACALPLSTVACGGGGDDASTTVDSKGTHYGYVVSKALVPTTSDQQRMYGLDLAGPKSGTPDGTVDNRLGELFALLAGRGFAIQATIDAAINGGSIILLVDFQATDLQKASGVGLSVKIGATPSPAPCTTPSDPATCGQHLKGTGTFTVAADSPANALVVGNVVNGTFNGGPGDLSLQIALGDTSQPLTLSLLQARAKATTISDTGMTVTVGGALTQSDLTTQVLPAVQTQVAGLITRDCPTATAANNCTCTSATSTGATLLTLFDGDDATAKDCKISVAEIAANALIKGLLAPDVCSMKTCTAPDALSLGIQVQTAKATIN